jgi:hypothetical protein
MWNGGDMRLLCSDESYYKLYVKKTVVYVFQHLPTRNKYITNCMLVVHTRAVDQYLTYSIQFVYISPQTIPSNAVNLII